jgi:dipeptidyl aminopeptidase/acylaminoacyl peptidase
LRWRKIPESHSDILPDARAELRKEDQIMGVSAFPQLRLRGMTSLNVLVTVLVLGVAGLAEDTFSASDLFRLKSVDQAVISPDGSEVCFSVDVPRRPFSGEHDGPPWEELHLLDGKGNVRALLGGHVNVHALAWTPDGKRVSFLANDESNAQVSLYSIDPDGGDPQKLVSFPTEITEYSWSPDQKQIAFLAADVIPDSKKKLQEQGFSQEVYEDEGQSVRVWIADLSGTGEPRRLDLPGSASELHWSPAGSLLAVALAPSSSLDDGYLHRKVHVVDAESGSTLTSLDNPGKIGQVAWSPDGKYIGLVSAADPHDPLEGRLLIALAVGGHLVNILPAFEGHITHFAWQDSDTLIFLGDWDVSTVFGSVRRDGSARRTFLGADGPVFTDFTISLDAGIAALVGSTAHFPSEVFLVKLGKGDPHRATVTNPWLDGVALAAQEVIRFRARDGLNLQGILIHPLRKAEDKRYPLILVAHGGPEGHYSNGWNTDYANVGQIAAASGFAVFYPNYRSSTGRGIAFSKMDHRDPGGKEFEDLTDAVDRLVSRGLVDRNRVGITGISYGGYASAWGATFYSDRFAASVVIAGLGDLVSYSGMSGNPDELYQVHYLVRPWEDWHLFQERSPIYHAQRRHTPTLILQGQGDPVVSGAQALETYNYFKWTSTAPVRLVYYPGEGHGFARAASQFDACLRLLEWMKHYLIGPKGPPPPAELNYATEMKPQ